MLSKNSKNNWQTKKLGNICEVIAGQSPEGRHYNKTGIGLPFYQGKKEFTDKYIGSPTTWTTEITKEAKSGDILMSVRAPVGPINYATEKICIGRGLAAIRAGKEIDQDYLFIFLRKHESEIVGNTGAVFNSINKAQIENIEIPLPPLPTQRFIVKKLDRIFAGIEKAKQNAEKNLQNARELFESYLQSIFTNPEYEIKALGELCESVEYGSSSKSKINGEIPVLRMGNIQEGRFNWDNLVYSNDDYENKKYLLKYNDVLFNRTNSPELVGKTAIYKGERPAIFAGYLIRIHRKERLLNADYLNYFLNSNIAKDYGKTIVISSVNQANINGAKLKSYPIPAPSLTVQKSIVAKLDALAGETKKLEAIYREKLADLEELKKAVLKKAFEGKL